MRRGRGPGTAQAYKQTMYMLESGLKGGEREAPMAGGRRVLAAAVGTQSTQWLDGALLVRSLGNDVGQPPFQFQLPLLPASIHCAAWFSFNLIAARVAGALLPLSPSSCLCCSTG